MVPKWLVVIALLLGGILLTLLSRGAFSQGPGSRTPPVVSAIAAAPGRYQLIPVGTGSNPYVYIIDTQTGQCWYQVEPGHDWSDATPAALHIGGALPAPPVK